MNANKGDNLIMECTRSESISKPFPKDLRGELSMRIISHENGVFNTIVDVNLQRDDKESHVHPAVSGWYAEYSPFWPGKLSSSHIESNTCSPK